MVAQKLLLSAVVLLALLLKGEAHTSHEEPDNHPPVPTDEGGSGPFRCRHDEVESEYFQRETAISGPQLYAPPAPDNSTDGSLPAPPGYVPIRITPYYRSSFTANMNAARAGLAAWVSTNIMGKALARFKEWLSVKPIIGRLQAHRQCLEYDVSFVPAICARYESETSVLVPAMTADAPSLRLLAPLLAEDTIVRIVGGLKRIVTLPAGDDGWALTDTTIFVSGEQTSICGKAETGGTIAYAVWFQKDQYDRPVFGQINLCPEMVSSLKQPVTAASFILCLCSSSFDYLPCSLLGSWL
jgi:hypothetical protein